MKSSLSYWLHMILKNKQANKKSNHSWSHANILHSSFTNLASRLVVLCLKFFLIVSATVLPDCFLFRETITGWIIQTKVTCFMYYSLFLSKCFCWWGKNSRLRNISMIFWCIYIVGLTPDEGGIFDSNNYILLN